MVNDVTVGIRLRGDSSGAVKSMALTRGELGKLEREMRQTARQAQTFDARFRSIGAGLSRVAAGVGALGATIGTGAAIGGLIRAADTYTKLEGRLRLVTDSSEELAAVEQKLFASAQRTSSEFASTVNLYAKLARNTESLGLSQNQLLTLTEEINQAFVISGASVTEASAATQQLTQAFASGVLRGEEFNSIMENSPRLARALADALGTTVGGLRKMAEAGQLTTDRVLPALLSKAGEIREEFLDMGGTVEQAMTRLQNAVNQAIGHTDMSPLIEAIDRLTEVASDPAVQSGIQTLATTAVNFIADMGEGLGALHKALEDLKKFQFGDALGGIGKRLMDNSGPGFLYRMLTGESWSDRVGDVLSGRGRSDLRARLDPVKVTAPAIKAAPINLPNIPAISPELFTVDADDLMQSMERELAKFDELLMQEFENKGKAIDLSNAITFELPKQGSESIAELEDQLDGIMSKGADMKQLGDDLGFAFSSSFEDAIVSAQSFGEVLQGLAQDIQRILLRQFVTKPLANAIGSGISGMFGTTTASANGNVFDAGRLVPFANGGIVNGPTVFPMQNGMGLMGEAGPEAVLPLRRGPGGKLGVRSSGGVPTINAPITINAPNADRQSVTDIARIAQRLPAMVVSTITQDVARDGPISRSLRR